MQTLQLPEINKNFLTLFHFIETPIQPENIGFTVFNECVNSILPPDELDTRHIKNFEQLWTKKKYNINSDFLPKIQKNI